MTLTMSASLPKILVFALLLLFSIGVSAVTTDQLAIDGNHTTTQKVTDSIPFKQQDVLNRESVGRLSWVLALAVLVIVGLAWVLKLLYQKMPRQLAGNQRIRLIESRRLTSKLTLTLVEIEGQIHTLADNGTSLLQLNSNKDPVETDKNG